MLSHDCSVILKDCMIMMMKESGWWAWISALGPLSALVLLTRLLFVFALAALWGEAAALQTWVARRPIRCGRRPQKTSRRSLTSLRSWAREYTLIYFFIHCSSDDFGIKSSRFSLRNTPEGCDQKYQININWIKMHFMLLLAGCFACWRFPPPVQLDLQDRLQVWLDWHRESDS